MFSLIIDRLTGIEQTVSLGELLLVFVIILGLDTIKLLLPFLTIAEGVVKLLVLSFKFFFGMTSLLLSGGLFAIDCGSNVLFFFKVEVLLLELLLSDC